MRGKLHKCCGRALRCGLIPACAGKTASTRHTRLSYRAHPRVCGENIPRLSLGEVASGSSPRVRGKLPFVAAGGAFTRLIPACAGKTPPEAPCASRSRAHPRVCGENVARASGKACAIGSSPRVRGKPLFYRHGEPIGGLIPACAGKTIATERSPRYGRAHPRVCGENSFHAARARWLGGSSPRVRGKLKRVKIGDVTAGLIPACAGKTTTTRRTCRTAWAHPRVCGENALLKSSAEILPGSSPRVRGKRQPDRCLVVEVRLIPACAGKTRAMVDWEINRRAHPRVCGENGLCRDRRRRDGGSSPRVRGKQPQAFERAVVDGLIPACAGKTEQSRWHRLRRPAHPRVCGENVLTPFQTLETPGSSPRVRGKRSLYACSSVHLRLIPACAGKTESTRRVICNSLAHPRVCGENTPAKSGTPG